ncbi:hypothetical protein ACC723_37960, partial [Rhizobium ruizarguesonis]
PVSALRHSPSISPSLRSRLLSLNPFILFSIDQPIAAIWSGAMMLEHLGEKAAEARVMASIEATTARGIGAIPGKDKTDAITASVLSAIG